MCHFLPNPQGYCNYEIKWARGSWPSLADILSLLCVHIDPTGDVRAITVNETAWLGLSLEKLK